MRDSSLRVVVAGSVAGAPGRGGTTWSVIQYVLGLRRLGHDVLLVEPVREASSGPEGTPVSAWFQELARRFGLEGRAALLRPDRACEGLPYGEVLRFCRSADLLLNLDGVLRDPALVEGAAVRAHVRLDPGSAPAEEAVSPLPHDHYFATALAVGTKNGRGSGDRATPAATLQPIVLEEWPVDPRIRYHAFTAIAPGTWRAVVSREPEGYVHVPERARARFLLTVPEVEGDAAPFEALRRHGWAVVERSRVANTPDGHRSFIQGSLAGFALSESDPEGAGPRGEWCGCTGASYLASGRPLLVEDTGFGEALPLGNGVLPFKSAEDVADAVETLHSGYRAHAQGARRIAEAFFDSDRVLTHLLDRVDSGPGELSLPA